jgi:hypothetical protein
MRPIRPLLLPRDEHPLPGPKARAASHPLQAQEAVLFAYFADRIAFYSKSAEALGIVGNTNP